MNGESGTENLNNRKKITILFGGNGEENYKKSCDTAADLHDLLDKEKYSVNFIGITAGGKMMLTPACSDMIRSGEWKNIPFNRNCAVSFDSDKRGFILLTNNYCGKVETDCAFSLVYGDGGTGKYGAALFDMLEIKHAGSRSKACEIAKDSFLSRLCTEKYGIKSVKTEKENISVNIERAAKEKKLIAAVAENQGNFMAEVCEYNEQDGKTSETSLSDKEEENAKQTAINAFKALEARSFALVGLIADENSQIVFDYIDTYPMLNKDGAYMSAMKRSGIDYEKMLNFIITMPLFDA